MNPYQFNLTSEVTDSYIYICFSEDQWIDSIVDRTITTVDCVSN